LCNKNPPKKGSNERHARTREEHDELLAESLLADRPLGAHGPTARGAWTVRMVRRQQLELDLMKVNTSFPLPDLPNQPMDYYQIIGEGEAPLADAMPTNL
jgi:hypothetical protein